MKDWQHGYELDTLAAIARLYETYNRYSASVFSQVRPNVVARLLHEGKLHVLPTIESAPGSAYAMAISKVTTPITMYQDVVIGVKQPGDVTLTHLAGEHTLLIEALRSQQDQTCWACVFVEDEDINQLLMDEGFIRIGTKISTFAEMSFIYLRERSASLSLFGDGRAKALDPAEAIHIKRLGTIDPNVLAALTARVNDSDLRFTNHYSNYNKSKSWSAVSLRGFLPDPLFIAKPVEMSKKWKAENISKAFALEDTPLMQDFPEVPAIISEYADAAERVRLMALAYGGGELTKHTDQVDPDTGVRLGNNARLHIPIITNPDVVFTSWGLDGQPTRVTMQPGDVWYLDTRKPHTAVNRGQTRRVHLVIDVIVTERFRARLLA